MFDVVYQWKVFGAINEREKEIDNCLHYSDIMYRIWLYVI